MAKGKNTDEAATKRGRPTAYTPEVAAAICDRLMQGESLRKVCLDDEMPALSTVCNWLASNHPDFLEQYTRAREIQAEMLADAIIDIADDDSQDTLHTEMGPKPNMEWIARTKVRVEARQWVATKLLPKKYGNKIEQTVITEQPLFPDVPADNSY